MRGGSHRIAHIVKAIEERNQIEVATGKLLRGGHLEANVIESRFLHMLIGVLNRRVVKIEPNKC